MSEICSSPMAPPILVANGILLLAIFGHPTKTKPSSCNVHKLLLMQMIIELLLSFSRSIKPTIRFLTKISKTINMI